MKQETKELVDWIKKQINIAKTDHIDKAWNGQHEWYNKDYDKAIAFLDSLPVIESHLCRGGYIQDRNGTPCKDGDRVLFALGNGEKLGVLEWLPKEWKFVVTDSNDGERYTPKSIIYCEVEEA